MTQILWMHLVNELQSDADSFNSPPSLHPGPDEGLPEGAGGCPRCQGGGADYCEGEWEEGQESGGWAHAAAGGNTIQLIPNKAETCLRTETRNNEFITNPRLGTGCSWEGEKASGGWERWAVWRAGQQLLWKVGGEFMLCVCLLSKSWKENMITFLPYKGKVQYLFFFCCFFWPIRSAAHSLQSGRIW